MEYMEMYHHQRTPKRAFDNVEVGNVGEKICCTGSVRVCPLLINIGPLRTRCASLSVTVGLGAISDGDLDHIGES